MWHHHQVCAGPNSALPAVNSSIQSYLALGAKPEKLILGLPGYGYEYRCNDSFPSPSTFAPCASSTCIVGDLKHYSTEHYGVGAWSIGAKNGIYFLSFPDVCPEPVLAK
jgi:hypothetical protein